MRCEQCKAKTDHITNYGGVNMCDSCNDRHNPKINTVYRLSEKHRKALEDKIKDLQSQTLKIKEQLKTDDKIIASGDDHVHFTSSYFHTFGKSKN